jgi:hypothetical protein
MSVTLATIADALIEFILSLLRDPEAAEEFEKDPEAALTSRGLGNATAADVCAVAPVIAERAQVVPIANPKPAPPEPRPDPSPTVREINTITNSFSYVDDRDTVVDQSVNQNIWAEGDVTQVFDQDAVVASGDESMAAGDDASVENNIDQSTDIDAGDDVAIDSDITENTATDSNNTTTDTTTTTDASTTTTVADSANQSTETATADDSFNNSAAVYTETSVDSETTGVFDSTDSVVMEEVPADDNF